MGIINLDNCSTTKVYDEVLELHNKLVQEYYYNSNAMSDYSFKTNQLLQLTKNKIKKLLDFNGNVVFTSGATLSNNIIIQGFFKDNINKISKVITTKVEHPSITNVVANLDQNISKQFLNFDHNQEFDYVGLEESLKIEPALVTTCLVNNTTGIVVDYKKIYAITKKYNSYLHLDITQGLCKIDFDTSFADFMSCSMHKIGGLKGGGLILQSKNTKLAPIIYGGGSDSELIPGTMNAPTFITIGKTIELALNKYNQNIEHVKQLKLYLVAELKQIDYINVNEFSVECSNFVTTFSVNKLTSEIILNYLDENEIIVSSGSACSSKYNSTTEKILQDYNIKNYKNTFRVCFNYETTKDDIKIFIKKLKEGLEKL